MPVGAIVAWPHGVTYPTGWVLCDGVANASGSALDLRGRFLVGWDGSHASAGGSASHTHAGHVVSYPATPKQFDQAGPDGSVAVDGHDSPNSEPPYSPIDWIERLT